MVCFAVFSESTNALNYSIYITKIETNVRDLSTAVSTNKNVFQWEDS